MLEKLIGSLVLQGLKHLSKKSTNTVDDVIIDVVQGALVSELVSKSK